MINFIVWLAVGGITGLLASLVIRTDAQQGTLFNIVVGIVGAFVAGLMLTPLLGISTINQNNFSLPAMRVSLLGAIILLAVVSLVRRDGQPAEHLPRSGSKEKATAHHLLMNRQAQFFQSSQRSQFALVYGLCAG